jgi:hypothetical protein
MQRIPVQLADMAKFVTYVRHMKDLMELDILIQEDWKPDFAHLFDQKLHLTKLSFIAGDQDFDVATIAILAEKCPNLYYLGIRWYVMRESFERGKFNNIWLKRLQQLADALVRLSQLDMLCINFTKPKRRGKFKYGKHLPGSSDRYNIHADKLYECLASASQLVGRPSSVTEIRFSVRSEDKPESDHRVLEY